MTADELRARFEKWYPNAIGDVQPFECYVQGFASRDAEVEALQDALFQISVRLKADHEPDMDDMSWHTDMIARAQYFANVVTEVEALRKDAERYRFLRNSANISWNDWVEYENLMATDAEREQMDAAIDSAIDAAMREESK